MNKVTINAIFKLKRDNDYNYEKIKDKYIPSNGEMILVDTARNGLRAKIGDGVSTYANLKFVDVDIAKNIIVNGYFYNKQFYYDRGHNELISASENKIYIDGHTGKFYSYNGTEYQTPDVEIPIATSEVAGIMKLYNTVGENTDGTMTQKAISDEIDNVEEAMTKKLDSLDDELDDKVELSVVHEEELLVFTTNN